MPSNSIGRARLGGFLDRVRRQLEKDIAREGVVPRVQGIELESQAAEMAPDPIPPRGNANGRASTLKA